MLSSLAELDEFDTNNWLTLQRSLHSSYHEAWAGQVSAPFQGLVNALSADDETSEVIREFIVLAAMSAVVYPVPVIYATYASKTLCLKESTSNAART